MYLLLRQRAVRVSDSIYGHSCSGALIQAGPSILRLSFRQEGKGGEGDGEQETKKGRQKERERGKEGMENVMP